MPYLLSHSLKFSRTNQLFYNVWLKKKQEQEEVKDEYIMAVLDKRTNKWHFSSPISKNSMTIPTVSVFLCTVGIVGKDT
ncbi:hypothetical protein HMPREF2533_00099 [Bacteroides fragilis]|nr:hypothetical protein HMPREF2530_00099 [Bacteroides fragilis]KXU51209.1 hypothetical protein HMPREF2533_00099 [Bacteroides fragilis]OOD23916.1 hypothetical protein BWP07_15180 [Bacteroides fragilis]